MHDALIVRALQDAAQFHEGQRRHFKDDPHMHHVLRVTGRVMLFKDVTVPEITGTAWHDVGEDCCRDPSGQRALFSLHEVRYGSESLEVMRGLTKPSIFATGTKAERTAMDLRYMERQPLKIKRIKCIDRIDNVNESIRDLMAGIGSAKHGYGYAEESEALAKVLAGIDTELMSELTAAVRELRRVAARILNAS